MMMKNLNFLAILVIGTFTFLSFQGCDKDKDEIIEDITPEISCKLSGVEWETNVAAGLTSSIVAITATKGKEVILLSIPAKEVGDYPIDIITTNASYTPIIDSISNTYLAFEGEVKITSINTLRTQIQGSFNFKAANATTLDTIHITEGVLKNIPMK